MNSTARDSSANANTSPVDSLNEVAKVVITILQETCNSKEAKEKLNSLQELANRPSLELLKQCKLILNEILFSSR